MVDLSSSSVEGMGVDVVRDVDEVVDVLGDV